MNYQFVCILLYKVTSLALSCLSYSIYSNLFALSLPVAGMSAIFSVETCADAMGPDRRNANDEEDFGFSLEDLMSTVVFQRGGIASVLRSGSKGRPKVWVHYIATEEVTWDYAPNVNEGDR